MGTVTLNVLKKCTAIRGFVRTVNNPVIIVPTRRHAPAALTPHISLSVMHNACRDLSALWDTSCCKTLLFATANAHPVITTSLKIAHVIVRVVGLTTLEARITIAMNNVPLGILRINMGNVSRVQALNVKMGCFSA